MYIGCAMLVECMSLIRSMLPISLIYFILFFNFFLHGGREAQTNFGRESYCSDNEGYFISFIELDLKVQISPPLLSPSSHPLCCASFNVEK